MTLDEKTNSWMDGFITGIQKLKASIVEKKQTVLEPESSTALNQLLDELTDMEKRAFSEAPTVIAKNPLNKKIDESDSAPDSGEVIL